MGAQLLGRELNTFRTELGLGRVRRIFPWSMSPELAIGLFPSWYAEPQPDWPAQVRVADFPRFNGPSDEVDSRVLEFCRAGVRPIAITFGTGMRHAGELLRDTVEACARSGVRGILLSRHVEQVPRRLPECVRHFEFVPLGQLLPHCAGIVHHGGIGTVAAALSAGTPQLIIPHAWDQLDNARRVVGLGAGGMIGRRQASADTIAEKIVAVSDGAFSERCREIASRSGGEDGIENAAQWIEAMQADAV